MHDSYLDTLLESFGFDPAIRSVAGVSVAGRQSRVGSRAAIGYRIGEHLAVSCDPALEGLLTDALVGVEPTLQGWSNAAIAAGAEHLAAGRQQLLPSDLPGPVGVPDGYVRRSLCAESADDRALIARLIEVTDADDLDEAEVALDDLDPIIEVLVDAAGEIACYSAARPFDLAPAYGDIGILTRGDCRGLGLGAALVADLCHVVRAAGLEPLYRCDEDNAGSVRLSAGLGFEIATQLVAYRFPSDL